MWCYSGWVRKAEETFVMKQLKRVTVVVYLYLVHLSLGSTAAQNVTGRCCSASKGDGGSCPGAATGDFLPPINAEEENYVSWKTQNLDCPLTETVVYYDINNGSSNQLFLFGDKLILEFLPGDLFPKQTGQYCVEVHDGGYRAAVCQPDPEKICGDVTCIPKCCGEGEILLDYACTRGTGNMSLHFYSFSGKPIPAPTDMVMVGNMVPKCGGDNFPSFKEDISDLHLLVNGKLLERDAQVTHEFQHYCVEDMHLGEDHIPLFLMCSEPESTTIVVKHYLQRIGYIISVIFLVVTILFHIFIPSLRDTQGLCLVSHMVSMAVADIFLFILSLASFNIPAGFCIFSGFTFHYSFLAMFFWLNIMCFDVWRVIRNTARGIPLRGILDNDAKKFRLYSLYGWGGSLVVVVVAAIMHSLPEEHAKNITPPGFGTETCWITGDKELLIYCYGYVAALFILDLSFLGHAMYMLFEAGSASMCFKRQVSLTAFNRNHLEAFWQRFSLFILMVLVWTTEILSWKIPPRELWIVSDFVNSLQGFLVFIIFISNKKRRDMARDLLKKVPLPCFTSLKEATPLTSRGRATWNVTSPSASISGPSTGEVEISQGLQSVSKTDSSDNK